MKKVRLLVSVILFGFLLLSSCDKKDAILVNRRTATSERIKEVRVNASSLIKSLYAEGRPDKEIEGFVQLENEREYLGSSLGEIVRIGNHFLYRVNGKNYDGYQTINSCGIWAVRRKLRHMHHLGTYGIHEDAWYRCSDEEMRQIITDICGDKHARTGEMLDAADLVRLQMKFGIDENNATVRAINCKFPDNKMGVVYKEVLCVYNQEGESRRLRRDYEGGDFHGFDYDRWELASLGCRFYLKYPAMKTQRLAKILGIKDRTSLNDGINRLPKPDVSPVMRTIKPTIDLALETLTHVTKVIINPTLAKKEDFVAAKARSTAIADAPLNSTAAATAVYNAARAVILYGEYIIAEVVGIEPNERSHDVNAQAVAAILDILPPNFTALSTTANILCDKVSKAVDRAKAHAARARTLADSARAAAAQAASVRDAINNNDLTLTPAADDADKIRCMNAARDATDAAHAAATHVASARADARDAYNTVAEAVSTIIGRKIKDEDARAAARDVINNNDLTLTPDAAADNNFINDNAFIASSAGDYDLAAKCYARDAEYDARAAGSAALEAAIDAYVATYFFENNRELISNHTSLENSYSGVASDLVAKIRRLEILFKNQRT